MWREEPEAAESASREGLLMQPPSTDGLLRTKELFLLHRPPVSDLGLIMGISKVMFSTTVALSSQGFWEA